MRIDMRASAYPSLLEAVGLAIILCDGMEQTIPFVFRAALNCSLEFRKRIFDTTRGLQVHLDITTAAVEEGAPAFMDRWTAVAARVRSSAGIRGQVAHSGLSVYGGGLIVEMDDDGNPIGIRRAGPSVASLSKHTREGRKEITEAEVRQLADQVDLITRDLHQLANDITVSRMPS